MKFLSEKNKFILIVQFVLTIYLLLTLGISEYKNFKVQNFINEFDVKNQNLSFENELLSNELDYYSSPQYQEKIAKQNLGLINPGEKVLVIQVDDSLSETQRYELSLQQNKISRIKSLPNYKKWWYYLFS